jgi:predicted ArsR family transcriptional regulator
MARHTSSARTPTRPKKTTTPLTARAHAALKKHGARTSDGLAKILRVSAPATQKALSKLKLRGRAAFTRSRAGENIWRALGKARAR